MQARVTAGAMDGNDLYAQIAVAAREAVATKPKTAEAVPGAAAACSPIAKLQKATSSLC